MEVFGPESIFVFVPELILNNMDHYITQKIKLQKSLYMCQNIEAEQRVRSRRAQNTKEIYFHKLIKEPYLWAENQIYTQNLMALCVFSILHGHHLVHSFPTLNFFTHSWIPNRKERYGLLDTI